MVRVAVLQDDEIGNGIEALRSIASYPEQQMDEAIYHLSDRRVRLDQWFSVAEKEGYRSSIVLLLGSIFCEMKGYPNYVLPVLFDYLSDEAEEVRRAAIIVLSAVLVEAFGYGNCAGTKNGQGELFRLSILSQMTW